MPYTLSFFTGDRTSAEIILRMEIDYVELKFRDNGLIRLIDIVELSFRLISG